MTITGIAITSQSARAPPSAVTLRVAAAHALGALDTHIQRQASLKQWPLRRPEPRLDPSEVGVDEARHGVGQARSASLYRSCSDSAIPSASKAATSTLTDAMAIESNVAAPV